MANTSSLSLQDFNDLLKSSNSTLRQALLAKGENGRITGLSVSLKKGDKFVVAPGAEPQLTTVSGKAVVTGDTVAADAYWAFRGKIVRGSAQIKDVTIPVASFSRLGKEFPSLGAECEREGRRLPNRAGFELLQDLLEEFPVSGHLYRAQTDWNRATLLHGAGEGFTLTVEEVQEGYSLPYKSRADRERLEAAGSPWGSRPDSWRKISMLFVSMERNAPRSTSTRTTNRGGSNRGKGSNTAKNK